MKEKIKIIPVLFFFICFATLSFGQSNDVIVKVQYKNLLNEGAGFNFIFAEKMDTLTYRLKHIAPGKKNLKFDAVFKYPIVRFSDSADLYNCTSLFMKNYDSILEQKFKENIIVFSFEDNAQSLRMEFRILKNQTFKCSLKKKLWPSSSFAYQSGSYFSNIDESKKVSYDEVLSKIKTFCSTLMSKF